jgi:hypothetical protein
VCYAGLRPPLTAPRFSPGGLRPPMLELLRAIGPRGLHRRGLADACITALKHMLVLPHGASKDAGVRGDVVGNVALAGNIVSLHQGVTHASIERVARDYR